MMTSPLSGCRPWALVAAALVLAGGAPAIAQSSGRTVSCTITDGPTLHRGDCTLRRLPGSGDREELTGGGLRVEIVYRSRGGDREQVVVNGRPGTQVHVESGGQPLVNGMSSDMHVAYYWSERD